MDDAAAKAEMSRRSRRAFLVSAVAVAAAMGSWWWLKTRPQIDGAAWPVRRTFEFNEKISRALFSQSRLSPTVPAPDPNGPRYNGDIGLERAPNLEAWRLLVPGTDLVLTLDDLRTLPEVSETVNLNCIEGWTTSATWTGVRFRDFVEKFCPQMRGKANVGLLTPDADYYVGLDMASAMHPQTLLCYAINGAPLSNDEGAPLRLFIPSKYGIKNLKRLGIIRFTDERPPDYWAEQGYDWFAGL